MVCAANKREDYLMKKRTLSLILATAMVAGSLVGCGGGSAASSAPAEEPAAEAGAAEAEAPAAGPLQQHIRCSWLQESPLWRTQLSF